MKIKISLIKLNKKLKKILREIGILQISIIKPWIILMI